MRDDSKGRFERMQCVKCGAHAMVPVPATSSPRCEVCGGSELVPVHEQPRPLDFSQKEQPQA